MPAKTEQAMDAGRTDEGHLAACHKSQVGSLLTWIRWIVGNPPSSTKIVNLKAMPSAKPKPTGDVPPDLFMYPVYLLR